MVVVTLVRRLTKDKKFADRQKDYKNKILNLISNILCLAFAFEQLGLIDSGFIITPKPSHRSWNT